MQSRNSATALAILGALLAAPGVTAHAQSIGLSCIASQDAELDSDDPRLLGICETTERLLMERHISMPPELTLIVDTLTTDGFAGRMTWVEGTRRMDGPRVEIGVLDHVLDQTQFEFVARSLLSATNLPTPATITP